MVFFALALYLPDLFDDYQTKAITEIILRESENLFSDVPPNYTETLYAHKFNSTLQNAYEFASASFLAGVYNLFGLGYQRDQDLGLFYIYQAHRYGCNEATLLLADGHLKGMYGLARSEALAFGYYKEVARGLLAGISDSDAYQYNFNKYYLDLFLEGMDKYFISKAERQYILYDVIRKTDGDDLAYYSNILGMGAYTGSFGFPEDEENAAKFLFLGAAADLYIPIKDELNSYEEIKKYLYNKHSLNTNVGKDIEVKEEGAKSKLLKKIEKLFGFGSASEEQPQLSNIKLPSFMNEYAHEFDYDGINLLYFKNVLPFTPNAFLDALIRLGKEVSYEIYKYYSYLEIFAQLGSDPSKNEVYELLINSPSSLIMETATMFIEQTDHVVLLYHLRSYISNLQGSEEDYIAQMKDSPMYTRYLTETCSRRGQNFALLAVCLSAKILVPTEFSDSLQNRALARLMSVASAFYGCHMGLTSLGFMAIDGYRPGDKKKFPNLKAALVAFDVASYAGSFESSFFESVLLSRKLSEYYSRPNYATLFYFDKNFIAYAQDKFDPYNGIPRIPALAFALAEHAAHAGYLSGQILKAALEFEWGEKYKACYGIRKAVYFFAIDYFLYYEPRNIRRNLLFGILGEETSIYNNIREIGKLRFPVCYETRASTTECLQNGASYLLLELASGTTNPGVQLESSKLCAYDVDLCLNALFGFSRDYIEEHKSYVLAFLYNYIKNNAECWADAFLYYNGVFNRTTEWYTDKVRNRTAAFINAAVDPSHQLEVAINRCFYYPYTTVKTFSDCLLLHQFFEQLSGQYLLQIDAVQPYLYDMMPHARDLTEHFATMLGSVAFCLSMRYYSQEIGRLININAEKVRELVSASRAARDALLLQRFADNRRWRGDFEGTEALQHEIEQIRDDRTFSVTLNENHLTSRSEWIPYMARCSVVGDFTKLEQVDQMEFVEAFAQAALQVIQHWRTLVGALAGLLCFNWSVFVFYKWFDWYDARKANAELQGVLEDFDFAGGFENDTGK